MQRAFETEQHILLWNRPPGRQGDRALRAWIDDVGDAQHVSEDRFGDVAYGRVVEIERIPVTGVLNRVGGRWGLGSRSLRGGRAPAEEGEGFRLAVAARVYSAGRLRVTRLKSGRANDVNRVLRLVRALLEIGGVAGPKPNQNRGPEEAAKRNA